MNERVHVLLVEDSVADATLIIEVFEDERLEADVSVVRDGFEAIDFLLAQGKHMKARRPDLILLDLNMPKKDGRELLAEIKMIPAIQSIPVVILTTSQAEDDIVRSYKLNASCYIIKPIDLPQFEKIVRTIDEFWFNTVKYPKSHSQRLPTRLRPQI
jgi:chemotaxis family two-component system response regulator Rcp1